MDIPYNYQLTLSIGMTEGVIFGEFNILLNATIEVTCSEALEGLTSAC